MSSAQRLLFLLFHLQLCPVALGIYCYVGYGQVAKKDSRLVYLLSRSVWVRNCPESTFCFRASPVMDSAEALTALIGGDWNDEFWGQGGFVQGCQGDFDFDEGRKGDVVTLTRAAGSLNETGVHVIDEFVGSGRGYDFEVNDMCRTNLCSGAWGRLRSLPHHIPTALINLIVLVWLIVRSG